MLLCIDAQSAAPTMNYYASAAMHRPRVAAMRLTKNLEILLGRPNRISHDSCIIGRKIYGKRTFFSTQVICNKLILLV